MRPWCVLYEARFPERHVVELEEIVLERCFDAFLRAITGKLPIRAASMHVRLKQGTKPCR